jgi:hypothetical protein
VEFEAERERNNEESLKESGNGRDSEKKKLRVQEFGKK